jgi:hypothetical protein
LGLPILGHGTLCYDIPQLTRCSLIHKFDIAHYRIEVITPVAGKPYVRSWPLPGGEDKYLATLDRILEWIGSHPDASLGEALDWFRSAYKLKSASMADDYLDVLRQMGYLDKTKATISLTSAGRHYLQTKDYEFVLGRYLSECRGAWEVLNSVGGLGLANPSTVRAQLEPQFPWTSNSQFSWRLNWLLSLGCLKKMGREYKITSYGEQALQTYKGPGPPDTFRVPRVSKRTQVAPIQRVAESVEHFDVVAEKVAEPDHKSTSATPLDQLIAEIRRAALASDLATDFEIALSKAFDYLGFQATHKSGPGDTDILLEASLGHDPYRAIVDGKSSKHGKIPTTSVNWSALNKHRQAYNADYILVAAPGFSSGDLNNYAKEIGAALITADHLCEILRLHYDYIMKLHSP